MAVTLKLRSGDATVPELTLDAPRIVIGRGKSCELRLPDPSVSSRHASIRQRGSEYIVLDEGSSNGTFVQHVRLSPGAPRVLRDGDLLRLGRVWIEVSMQAAVPSANVSQLTREIALGLVAGALEADGTSTTPRIVVTSGIHVGAALALDRYDHKYFIGRDPNADLVLNDEQISRRHASVWRRGGDVFMENHSSKNAALVGNTPLERGAESRLRPRQAIVLGTTELEFEDPLGESMEQLEALPDELIDDSVDPPGTTDAPSSPAAQSQVSNPAPARGDAAPVIQAPRGASRRPSSPPRGRWSLTDVLVAALAMLVLLASVAGIAWLFDS